MMTTTRRRLLQGLLGSTAAAALSTGLKAQTTPTPVAAEAAEPFSFDALSEQMRTRATQAYRPAAQLESFLSDLTYDGYRNIQFNPEAARWNDANLPFRVHAFHPGWLYTEAVEIFEVVDGEARPMTFSTDDFLYNNTLAGTVPEHAELSGVAGFRLHYALNRPDVLDELIAFVGASYFRALGRHNAYGLSARGLAVNTWLEGPEEFPRFSAFYLERPAPGAREIVVNAALESPSLTGAYRFVIRPGQDTSLDVTARLFFREPVAQLGVAPLTSMFLFAEHSLETFDDYRPQVHDSNALMITRHDGDVLLRPLNNPPQVASSFLTEPNLKSFGLVQRDRAYTDYQDAEARYHDRPSVMIEPLNDWGAGTVRLVEIPTELEIEDNIVAFWVPTESPAAGDSREYRYRLHWGGLMPDPTQDLAWVLSTRTGHGGTSGVPQENDALRKLVIDFKGGLMGGLPQDATLEPVITASAGTLETIVLSHVYGTDIWRLVIDIDTGDAPLIELSAHVAGFGRKLSETWLFQWNRRA